MERKIDWSDWITPIIGSLVVITVISLFVWMIVWAIGPGGHAHKMKSYVENVQAYDSFITLKKTTMKNLSSEYKKDEIRVEIGSILQARNSSAIEYNNIAKEIKSWDWNDPALDGFEKEIPLVFE